jgi:hypothetical protein
MGEVGLTKNLNIGTQIPPPTNADSTIVYSVSDTLSGQSSLFLSINSNILTVRANTASVAGGYLKATQHGTTVSIPIYVYFPNLGFERYINVGTPAPTPTPTPAPTPAPTPVPTPTYYLYFSTNGGSTTTIYPEPGANYIHTYLTPFQSGIHVTGGKLYYQSAQKVSTSSFPPVLTIFTKAENADAVSLYTVDLTGLPDIGPSEGYDIPINFTYNGTPPLEAITYMELKVSQSSMILKASSYNHQGKYYVQWDGNLVLG